MPWFWKRKSKDEEEGDMLSRRARIRFHVVDSEDDAVNRILEALEGAKAKIGHYVAMPGIPINLALDQALARAVVAFRTMVMDGRFAIGVVEHWLESKRLGFIANACMEHIGEWDKFVKCIDEYETIRNERYIPEYVKPAVEEAKHYLDFLLKELPKLMTIEITGPGKVEIHINDKYNRSVSWHYFTQDTVAEIAAYWIAELTIGNLRAMERRASDFGGVSDVVRVSVRIQSWAEGAMVFFEVFPASFTPPEVVMDIVGD